MMGTAAYMSPEQIRGEKLDARTDLFSFGLVLYEMATGQAAFPGDTIATVHDGILRGTPKPPRESNPELPPKLEEIVGRALEKDRELRYHSAGDLRAELKRLKRETDSERVGAGLVPALSPRGGPAPVATGHPQGVLLQRRLWVAGSVATLVAGLAVAWFLFLHRPTQPPAELSQTRLTFNSSENPVESGAISPDGKYLAYSDATPGIHVRLLSSGDERMIPRPAGVPANFSWGVRSWFPDSTQLLADTEEGPGVQHSSMWMVSVLGQSPRELREGAVGWQVSPDGTRIAFSPLEAGDLPELWVMDSQGGNAQKLVALRENDWLRNVHWSPDGQRLGYVREQSKSKSSIETCDLKGANRTVVVPDSDLWLSDFCWLPDGRMIYTRRESGSVSNNLWQMNVNVQSGTPTGNPKRVTQEPGVSFGNLYASADGKHLTLLKAGMSQGQIYLSELGAGGTHLNPPRRLTNDEANNGPTAWTPDSKAVLFFSDRNDTVGIFKQGITQDTAEPVVTGPTNASMPRLSADGAWILYAEWPKRGASTSVRLMRIPLSGGVPQLVLETPNSRYFGCARSPANLCVVVEESQDNKQITVTAFDPLKGRGKVLRTIEKDPVVILSAAVSPDGSTLAISQGREGEIYIGLLSLRGGSDREITVKGWPDVTGFDWASDGKGFYIGSVSSRTHTLLYVDLKGNARSLWGDKGLGDYIWGVPSPDGRYLAIKGTVSNSNVWMLEGF
jgi:Tol biopolymer transport system component